MIETEADTRANCIDPVLHAAGWGVVDGAQVHRELIYPGRVLAQPRLWLIGSEHDLAAGA